jgi:hypothetical protein
MKCFLCERNFKDDEIGIDTDKNPALKLGSKAICVSCLNTLNMLLRQISISAKRRKL